MMQLGDIAMESAANSAANMQHAEKWYRKAAGGDPPQPNALFQMARIHHEVRAPQDTWQHKTSVPPPLLSS